MQDTGWRSLNPMQRYSICILLPQPTEENVSYEKRRAVHYCRVIRLFKKFCWSCKNFDNLASSVNPKIMNSETVLQAIEATQVSTRRVSGDLAIIQSSVVCQIHNLGKMSGVDEFRIIRPKYCKTFHSLFWTINTFLFFKMWVVFRSSLVIIDQHFGIHLLHILIPFPLFMFKATVWPVVALHNGWKCLSSPITYVCTMVYGNVNPESLLILVLCDRIRRILTPLGTLAINFKDAVDGEFNLQSLILCHRKKAQWKPLSC